MRLLILGGTTEGSALAHAMAGQAGIHAILSLAGRTENPKEPPIPFRIGGFGGADGLMAFLVEERIDAVIDATHPFAERISANAADAAARTGRPLAVFSRAPWREREGDDWRHVPDLDGAARALGKPARRVFLTSGRLGLSAFRQAPQHHYLVRSIDPPAPQDCPPDCEVILARGPFDGDGETALMRRYGIEVLVSKNSGGAAGAGKLDAARALNIPVVMVDRPQVKRVGTVFTGLGDVLAWIEHHRDASSRKAP